LSTQPFFKQGGKRKADMSEKSDPPSKEDPASLTPRGAGWRPPATPSQPAGTTPITPPVALSAPPVPGSTSIPSEPRQTIPPAVVYSQTTTDTLSRTNPATWWRIVLSLFFGTAILVCLFISLLAFSSAVRDKGYGGTWGWTASFAAGVGISVFILIRIWIRPVAKAKRIGNSPSKLLRGEVRGFRERVEQHGSSQYGSSAPDIIWSFRVERYQDGHRLSPIPVEMRGVKFKGFINEGDTVEIIEPWREGETVHPKQIFNVTNNANVSIAKPSLSPCGVVVVFFVAIIFLVVFLVFLAFLLGATGLL
jgi:hypothetical protein